MAQIKGICLQARNALELPFVHSPCCLPYDRFIGSSKASSPHSAIQCFLFKFAVISLSFKVILQLLTSYCSSPRHFNPSFYLSFNNVFQKAVPTQDVTNSVSLSSFIVCSIFLSSLSLCNTSSFLTCSVEMVFSILLQQHI